MPEKCTENCPLVPRVEALEKSSKDHEKRIGDLETSTAVQDTQLNNIEKKIDGIDRKLDAIHSKSGKRWDKLVETVLVSIVTGIIAFLLGRAGI